MKGKWGFPFWIRFAEEYLWGCWWWVNVRPFINDCVQMTQTAFQVFPFLAYLRIELLVIREVIESSDRQCITTPQGSVLGSIRAHYLPRTTEVLRTIFPNIWLLKIKQGRGSWWSSGWDFTFQWRGAGRARIPDMPRKQKTKNMNQKWYCKKFNEDFKSDPQ